MAHFKMMFDDLAIENSYLPQLDVENPWEIARNMIHIHGGLPTSAIFHERNPFLIIPSRQENEHLEQVLLSDGINMYLQDYRSVRGVSLIKQINIQTRQNCFLMSKPIKLFIDINIEYSHRLDFHVFPKNEVICFIVTNNMWEVSWADPNKHTLDLVMNWLLLFFERLKSMFWIFCYAGLPSMFSCATMAECNGFNPTKNKNWEQTLVIMFWEGFQNCGKTL